ncbi:hypothetical protein AMTR_s00072p00084920 [Amborella trichopoda]|uniref:Uncharacterized protein n=1 Tax=Amborella trichopoda TaxID=13333 RepID=W1NUR7_AMBTC|nr:hypothetical protein AMTR_s00072p00084920 [Amborella trichopoda]
MGLSIPVPVGLRLPLARSVKSYRTRTEQFSVLHSNRHGVIDSRANFRTDDSTLESSNWGYRFPCQLQNLDDSTLEPGDSRAHFRTDDSTLEWTVIDMGLSILELTRRLF